MDPQTDLIFLPYFLLIESEGIIIWKRPYEYIHGYRLTKEIISRFPLGNAVKLKKFVYKMYYKESCPIENPKIKQNDRLIEEDIKNDFNIDNKRMMKNFFRIFDRNDFYIINYRIQEEENQIENDILKKTGKNLLINKFKQLYL